jgi:hypothetical protein
MNMRIKAGIILGCMIIGISGLAYASDVRGKYPAADVEEACTTIADIAKMTANLRDAGIGKAQASAMLATRYGLTIPGIYANVTFIYGVYGVEMTPETARIYMDIDCHLQLDPAPVIAPAPSILPPMPAKNGPNGHRLPPAKPPLR